jgi:metallophosphoesterase superfamily enzyme
MVVWHACRASENCWLDGTVLIMPSSHVMYGGMLVLHSMW